MSTYSAYASYPDQNQYSFPPNQDWPFMEDVDCNGVPLSQLPTSFDPMMPLGQGYLPSAPVLNDTRLNDEIRNSGYNYSQSVTQMSQNLYECNQRPTTYNLSGYSSCEPTPVVLHQNYSSDPRYPLHCDSQPSQRSPHYAPSVSYYPAHQPIPPEQLSSYSELAVNIEFMAHCERTYREKPNVAAPQYPIIPLQSTATDPETATSSAPASLHDSPRNTKEPRKPSLACNFCRERKIACGRPPEGSDGLTCNQCARRSFQCKYDERQMKKEKRAPRKK